MPLSLEFGLLWFLSLRVGWSAFKFDLWQSVHRLSDVGEDGMFRPILGPDLGWQIRVVENTDD